jgi:hypothetical protein
MLEIAFAAGFGSLRQFNRACQDVFKASPRELRARRRVSDRLVADGGLCLRLPFYGQLDWGMMIDYFPRGPSPALSTSQGTPIAGRSSSVQTREFSSSCQAVAGSAHGASIQERIREGGRPAALSTVTRHLRMTEPGASCTSGLAAVPTPCVRCPRGTYPTSWGGTVSYFLGRSRFTISSQLLAGSTSRRRRTRRSRVKSRRCSRSTTSLSVKRSRVSPNRFLEG